MRRSKKQLNSALRRRRQGRLVVGNPESLERRQLLTASPFGSPEDVARLAGSQLPLVGVDEASLATNLVASSFGSATGPGGRRCARRGWAAFRDRDRSWGPSMISR